MSLIPDLQNIVDQFQAESYVYLVYRPSNYHNHQVLIGCFTVLSNAIECALSWHIVEGTLGEDENNKHSYNPELRSWTFSSDPTHTRQSITIRRCPLEKEINKKDSNEKNDWTAQDYTLSRGQFCQQNQLCDQFDHIQCYQDWKRDIATAIQHIPEYDCSTQGHLGMLYNCWICQKYIVNPVFCKVYSGPKLVRYGPSSYSIGTDGLFIFS